MKIHSPAVRLVRFGIKRLDEIIEWAIKIGKKVLMNG